MVEYYNSKKEEHQNSLEKTLKKLRIISAIRFVVFCTTITLIYLLWGNATLTISLFIAGTALFVYFLNQYLRLNKKKKLLQKLVNINVKEIDYANGNYASFYAGDEFIEPKHVYSYDIDLFGKGSFFQFINRTETQQGTLNLSSLLTSNNIKDIQQKQKAIQELSEKTDWRQLFAATASLIKTNTPVSAILTWIENYKPQFPKKTILASNVFSMISLVLFTLIILNVISSAYLITWFFIGITISGIYLKKVNTIHSQSTKTTAIFQQYYQILKLIENEKFNTLILQKEQQKTQHNQQSASDIFKAFSKTLDALDQRNNILLAFIRNGLFLADIKQVCKIEDWIKNNKNTTRAWFDVIAYFDAQNSLATFKFNHSDFVFPEITNNNTIVSTKNLGHPLINKNKRITNDYSIDSQAFFIITGSNMAGKSTFLRTVALNIMMANIGLPVCAESMKYKPVKLITSMRTSDSLTDNTSYFFAEIKRLKFIINTIKNQPYFILLDEILKGTNSVDKANGSQKFVEKLINSKATGIIATHDLSLCSVTDTYANIKNYYFDSEITNNELVFDYKIKNGICKNMNASFLLKKMEII